MTDEEKAEEYIFDNYCRKNCEYLMQKECLEGIRTKCSEYEIREKAYLAGLHEGQLKWHDLRKDPNDLPKGDIWVLAYYDKGVLWCRASRRKFKDGTFWINSLHYTIENVIAWCEIPQFKE